MYSCIFSDTEQKEYFRIIGKGCIYNSENNTVIKNEVISVFTHFESHGWGTTQPIREDFISDSTGYFYVKFIKKYNGEIPTGYDIVSKWIPYNKISQANSTIILDTIFIN